MNYVMDLPRRSTQVESVENYIYYRLHLYKYDTMVYTLHQQDVQLIEEIFSCNKYVWNTTITR